MKRRVGLLLLMGWFWYMKWSSEGSILPDMSSPTVIGIYSWVGVTAFLSPGHIAYYIAGRWRVDLIYTRTCESIPCELVPRINGTTPSYILGRASNTGEGSAEEAYTSFTLIYGDSS